MGNNGEGATNGESAIGVDGIFNNMTGGDRDNGSVFLSLVSMERVSSFVSSSLVTLSFSDSSSFSALPLSLLSLLLSLSLSSLSSLSSISLLKLVVPPPPPALLTTSMDSSNMCEAASVAVPAVSATSEMSLLPPLLTIGRGVTRSGCPPVVPLLFKLTCDGRCTISPPPSSSLTNKGVLALPPVPPCFFVPDMQLLPLISSSCSLSAISLLLSFLSSGLFCGEGNAVARCGEATCLLATPVKLLKLPIIGFVERRDVVLVSSSWFGEIEDEAVDLLATVLLRCGVSFVAVDAAVTAA